MVNVNEICTAEKSSTKTVPLIKRSWVVPSPKGELGCRGSLVPLTQQVIILPSPFLTYQAAAGPPHSLSSVQKNPNSQICVLIHVSQFLIQLKTQNNIRASFNSTLKSQQGIGPFLGTTELRLFFSACLGLFCVCVAFKRKEV